MDYFQSMLNILRTAMEGLGTLVSWIVNFHFNFGGFSFLGLEIPTFEVNFGMVLGGGFIGACVVLIIVHLINVISG